MPCEDQVPGREGSFPVLALSHEFSVPTDPTTGLPTTGNPHHPLRIRIGATCGAIPMLYQAAFSGETLTTVDVRFFRTTPQGGQEHYLSLRLTQAQLISISAAGAGVDLDSQLLLSMTYGTISVIHVSGTEATASWEQTP